MKKAPANYKRLPIRFHQTFIPEKLYLSALLRFAASSGAGNEQEIAARTGIPTGKSSGKVPAIMQYATGMGLVNILKGEQAGTKRLELTDFGRTVWLEDPDLNEPLSLWMAHWHLCRADGGAEVWHLTFGTAFDTLGTEFSEKRLENYLAQVFQKRSRSLIGPMIRMYEEPASFSAARVLARHKDSVQRYPAPILKGYANGYAALLLSLWERHFPASQQVTLNDFETETYWRRISGWDERQTEAVLDMLFEKRAIDVDRQTRPWILMRKAEAKTFWRNLYADLA